MLVSTYLYKGSSLTKKPLKPVFIDIINIHFVIDLFFYLLFIYFNISIYTLFICL